MRREIREVTCIICPVGCKAKVVLVNGKVLAVRDVECTRGKTYATNECTTPVRDFFTTVRVKGTKGRVLPVRTTGPIPKDMLMDCAREISKTMVEAPVKLGEIVVKNILGLNVDVVATRDLDAV